jgi:hypothetical protein
MSGVTVERRDQVFTTFFSKRLFMDSIVFDRLVSTKAPFLTDRAIVFS